MAAGLGMAFRLALSALEVFDRSAWRSAVAQADEPSRMARGSDAVAAAVGLGATLDGVLTLAGRLGTLVPALPDSVLSALEGSYFGWTATIRSLPPQPEFEPVWRSRLAGEVPLRLTAAAVSMADRAVDADEALSDDEAAGDHDAVDMFELGLGDRLAVSLAALHPSLPGRLRAAREALLRDGERAAAQAANELVELVNHAIRLGATDEDVRA